MKSIRKMARKIAITLLIVLVGQVLGCHPAGIPFAEAATGPKIKCTSDLNCPPGLFCWTESVLPTKHCSPCQKCEIFGRHPSKLTACVRRWAQCGPCLDGYVETQEGKPCKISTATERNPIINTDTDLTVHKSNPVRDDAISISHIWWVTGLCFLGFVSVVVACAAWIRNKRLLVRQERRGINRFSSASQRRCEERRTPIATAPPVSLEDEYQIQPAFNVPTVLDVSGASHDFAYRLETERRHPRMKMERFNRADPFQTGYGAGDWAPGPLLQVGVNEGPDQNLDELEDFVDGNAAGEMNPVLNDPEDDANVPMLEGQQENLPPHPDSPINVLDGENIENILNHVHPLQYNNSIAEGPPPSFLGDFYLGFRIDYSLSLERNGNTSVPHRPGASSTFDPSETVADMSLLIASGPGSPESGGSNDSGTNMEDNEQNFEYEDDEDGEDETTGSSRVVPIQSHRTAQDSVLYNDEDSFDSMYEDAMEDELEVVD